MRTSHWLLTVATHDPYPKKATNMSSAAPHSSVVTPAASSLAALQQLIGLPDPGRLELKPAQAFQGGKPRLSVSLASDADTVRAAQRLRYQVFAEELGARLPTRIPGIDHDVFDPYCQHLVVRDEASAAVVGTYRILAPEAARHVGSYYAETEFDLVRLAALRPRLVEIGRACVHPDYRTGAVIVLLWSGLARYMREHGHDYLLGCASVSMHDGGHAAASLYQKLLPEAACPPEYQVFPRCPLPLAALDGQRPVTVPPLLRGYLKAGAWICGAPAWDPDFNTADLPLLLPMARMSPRYAQHFGCA